MSTTIIVIIVGVALLVFGALGVIFFSGKKKKQQDGGAKEKSIEPAIQTDRKKEEPKAEEPPVKVTMPEQNFKAIRKQSRLKINKKAIKGDSRNPSISKVFANGKKIDEIEESPAPNDPEPEKTVTYKGVPIEVGRFGAREPEFTDHSVTAEGMPNRSPRLEDRTNFGSHLSVSEDNNLSGVSGTGIAKVVEKSDSIEKGLNQKRIDVVQNARINILGESPIPNDPLAFLQGGGYGIEPEEKSPKDKLKSIDAQTLIIADAVAKPRGRKR